MQRLASRTSPIVNVATSPTRHSALEFACNHFDRRGRLMAERLLAEHRLELPVPGLPTMIAPDCFRMQA
jgi:hypothetical protein